MADYGIKISVPGNDVLAATARYLSLTTGQNLFKVFASGSSTVNASSTLTIAHNLTYKPNFLVFIESVGVSGQMELCTASLITNKARAYANNTNLYVKNTHTASRPIFYYIMYDAL